MTQPLSALAMLSLKQAAQYCGMSPDSFLVCVSKGRFPKPVDLPIRRRLWERAGLDAAIAKGAHINDATAREAEWRKRYEDRAPDTRRRLGQRVQIREAG